MNLPARTRTSFMPTLLVKLEPPSLRVRSTSSCASDASDRCHDGTPARAATTAPRTTRREEADMATACTSPRGPRRRGAEADEVLPRRRRIAVAVGRPAMHPVADPAAALARPHRPLRGAGGVLAVLLLVLLGRVPVGA